MSDWLRVESIQDRLEALYIHQVYLSNLQAKLKENGSDNDPYYLQVSDQICSVDRLINETNLIRRTPLNRYVIIKKSRKIPENSVARVKYVYSSSDREYANVLVQPGKVVSVSLKQIEAIDLPPLPDWIPAPGMLVKTKDGNSYLALAWEVENVCLANPDAPLCSPWWIFRDEITEINGLPV